MAAPEDGVVARGSATITQSGKKTDIRQSSNKVILDWRSFDIGADEHTEFHQPSKNAIALNRINDTKASRIDGKLSANGNIMLINPNGVVFGAGAQVDVGSLTATTADIDNDDFMAGKMDFKNAGSTVGAIINNGSISVKEAGLVNFVAPKVENNGVIVAKMGKVQLAAADTFTLDMAGDGVLQVAVSEEDSQKIARNSGAITAEGGYVAVTAAKARGLVDSLVDNTGVIEASSMTAKGGKIILSADGGTTSMSGTIKANGQTGGGEILIGGDYQGKGATKNSKTTTIASGAVVEASAAAAGDGGTVIVWSDEKTDVAGSIAAKGGALSGKGGFVETSSKKHLTIDTDTNIAVGGKSGAGEWLVDPEDIVISDAGDDGNAATSDIATATINGTLNGGGNVTITTSGVMAGSGDITVTGATIDKSTANNDATLTLQAHRHIVIDNSTINSTSGDALNVVLNADRDADQNGTISMNASTVNTNGGNFIAGGGDGALGGVNGILGDGDGTGADDVAATATGSGIGIYFGTSDITTSGGSVLLTGTATGAGTAHGVNLDRTNISTGAGDIKLVGHSTGNTSTPKGISLGGSGPGMSLLTTDGDISMIATSIGSQAIYVWEDVVVSTTNGDIDISAYNGNGTSDLGAGGTTPTNTISSTNGDVTIVMDDANITDFQSIYAGGTLKILPYNTGTSIGLGGGAGTLNFTDVELSRLDGAGKLVFGDALLGTGDLAVSSWNLSSKLFDVELYGNDISIAGVTMGMGDFMAYARDNGVDYGDLSVTANITRDVDGMATLDLRADRNIFNSGGADIIAGDANSDGDNNAATSADGLTVILNADRNADQDGAIAMASSTITTNGGNFIAGGGAGEAGGVDGIFGNGDGTGADDVAAWGNSTYVAGIGLTSTSVSAGAGSIYMRGQGYANSVATNHDSSAVGVRLLGSSLVTTDNGSINLHGIGGGTVGSNANIGVYLRNGNTVQTTNGDINIYGRGAAVGIHSRGFALSSIGVNSITTVNGYIDIQGEAADTSRPALNLNSGIYSTGSGDITLTAINSSITTENAFALGGATASGDITLETDLLDLVAGTNIQTSGDILVKPRTASTSIGLGGAGGDLNITDAELGYFNGTGKLIIGDSAGSSGNVIIQSWDLSSKLFDTEIYGNNITIGGLTMGRNFMAYAMAGANFGDMNISSSITRALNGDATLDLRADRNIVNSNDADIVASDANSDSDGNPATSADGLTVILNSDRNANGSGAVALTNATITTLGGDFIVGGGLDPLANATQASNREIGIELNNTQVSAGAGDISLIGRGENSGNDNFGVSLTNGSSLHSTDGDITLTGYGGNGGSGNLGLYFQSSSVESDNGDIQLTGTGGAGYEYNYGIGVSNASTITSSYGTISLDATSGSNGLPGTRSNDGLVVEGGSVISSTGTGAGAATISIDATGASVDGFGSGLYLNNGSILTKDGDIDIIGHTQYYAGIALGNNAVIEADGSANITLTGTETVGLGAGALQSANGSNRIGGATTTGTITLIGDTINYSNISIETSGTTHVKAYTPSTSIGLGGGGGTLNLSDGELGYFNGTGTLIIGDAASGTGDIDLDSWDISAKSFDVELYGNDIDIGGLTMGAGDVLAHAMDNGGDYGDLNFSANITRAVDDIATLDLRADGSITNSGGADIVASDTNSDADANASTDADSLNVILNADRDGDNSGAVDLIGATITTMGGYFVAGGGAGDIGGADHILGNGDGTGADDTMAWGNAAFASGVALRSSSSINTGAGSIFLNGHGKDDGSASSQYGVNIAAGGNITTTSGNIQINGHGGQSLNNSYGVQMNGSTVSTATGFIDILAQSGVAPSNNSDFVIFNNSVLESTGSGSIRVTTSANASPSNFNVGATGVNRIGSATMTGDIEIIANTIQINDTDNTILSQGDIYLKPLDNTQSIGLAGGSGGFDLTINELSNFNGTGKLIFGNSLNGTGDIDLNNWDLSTKFFDVELYGNDIDIGALTMGAGDVMAYASDNGVDYGDLIVSGAVTRGVAGVSNLNLDADRDVTFNNGANITSTTGEIDVTLDADHDNAGGGSIIYNAASIDTNGGDITFADAVAVGADADWNARGGTFTSGGAITLGAYDLDITADSVALGGAITGNAGSVLTLKPYDNTRSIGLGGGAGGFNLSDAELAGLTVGHLVIGDSASGAGDIAIQSWSLSGKSYDIELYGRDIDINGMTMGGGAITMIAGNDVTTSGAVGNSGAGGDLYIDVGNDFTNTAGAAAIAMGAGGRYLIYIDTLSNITRGGLTTGNLFGRDYTNDDPTTISTAFGNRFVFDETPTITVRANDVTLGAYNAGYNSFTYAVTGLASGDTAGSALSGTPAYAKTQLTPTTYSVTPSTGSLASTLGYLVSFQDGTLTMPVSGGGTPPANTPSSPVYNIPGSVEQQIQLPDLVFDQGYELMTQASPYAKAFAGATSGIQDRIINRKSENFRVTTDEADSFTRMTEGGYLQYDQPTADYYGLLFYQASYSEAP